MTHSTGLVLALELEQPVSSAYGVTGLSVSVQDKPTINERARFTGCGCEEAGFEGFEGFARAEIPSRTIFAGDERVYDSTYTP